MLKCHEVRRQKTVYTINCYFRARKDKTLNILCPGHNTVWGSQLASEGWYFRWVKNNEPYLEDISLEADD